MPRARLRSLTLALSSLLLSVALSSGANAQRVARAVRTETPPVIDGVLSDSVWAAAQPLEELYQIAPREGTPSERTEIRILYDSHNIYFGFRMFDDHAEDIIATTHERDAFLDSDDRFEMVIDTFLDRRNSFFFQMNAVGSKGDALISNGGSDFNKPWDGIWEGKATRDAKGWSAELALPFKTMSFKEGLDTWGFNFMRYIGRHDERDRWNNPSPDTRLFEMAKAGQITGLHDLEQGIGLDVIPFFTSNWAYDRAGDGDSHVLGDPGLDAFYKITPNLTLSLTLNTDFAETEVDERQINLTRFPLFFPERRDFFLQDSGVFSFANGFSRPFFSRTIGLSGGEVVPILGGVKLTGRAGDYNIGVLDVQTDDTGDVDGQNLSVVRVAKNIGEQSSIGAIVTNGDPTGAGSNTVYGLDASFRTNTFQGDQTVQANVWALASSTDKDDGSEDNDDASAFGLSFSLPSDSWNIRATAQEIQANFNPELGFVRRRGIRQYSGGVSFNPRINTDTVRRLEFSIDTDIVTDTNDVLETWWTEVQPLGIEWETGDALRLEIEHVHDELRQDFEISDGITIPADAYDYDHVRLELASAARRDAFGGLSVGRGSFFDGDRTSISADAGYHFGSVFTGSVEYRQNNIDLDDGSFETQIARMRTLFSFSPSLSWNTFIQWDNVSEAIGINSRIRYIPSPGHEMFLVFNEALDENGDSLSPLYQQVAFKIAYTIRL